MLDHSVEVELRPDYHEPPDPEPIPAQRSACDTAVEFGGRVCLCAYEYESTYLVGNALREGSCNMTPLIS